MPTRPAFTAPKSTSYDVIIVGGAMLGASIAWFLADNPDFDGRILVVERDPTYAKSSTAHTNSCMRQQFSESINIKISQYGADYVRNFRKYMGNDPRIPDVTFQCFGYMYLADTPEFVQTLRANQQTQRACGAATELMSPAQIAQRYPFYNLDDILLGSHNRVDEGYFDGNTLFDWWRRKGAEAGVEYLANEVVEISTTDQQVSSVVLATGEVVSCGTLVNASGPRAARTAAMAGLTLPVEPRRRFTFIFDAQSPLQCELPLTIDPSGVHIRSDGTYYMAGCRPNYDPAVDYDDFSDDFDIWEDKVWPAIANRIPQFEALKLINSWVGHYAYNTLDQNAIIGPHPELKNFMFLNGFSGHGFQQAPAMGRGLAELITYGSFRSLDLQPFSYDRVKANRPFLEQAVI